MTTSSSLRRGLVAGVCSGILAAVFAFVVAEPTLDRAIALEGRRAAAAAAGTDSDGHAHAADTPAHEHGAAAAVSRDTQRRVGAPAGFVLIGAAFGAIFGLMHSALRRATSGDGWQRALALGGAAVLAFVVVPFLRYPPNPPGVGDPDRVNELTRYYLASLLLGTAVVVGAWRLLRTLRSRGWPPAQRQSVTGVGAIGILALGFAVLPSPSTDLAVPASLLWEFRLQALATQLLLAGGLTAVFGVLAERAERSGR